MTTAAEQLAARIPGFTRHQLAKAEAGLRAAAGDAATFLVNTAPHGDVTGATRASYTAAVITPQDSGQAALAKAVAVVEEKNPGHSATSRGRLPGQYGVVLYAPTTYQRRLEARFAGEFAALAPTLAAFADEFTARAARGR